MFVWLGGGDAIVKHSNLFSTRESEAVTYEIHNHHVPHIKPSPFHGNNYTVMPSEWCSEWLNVCLSIIAHTAIQLLCHILTPYLCKQEMSSIPRSTGTDRPEKNKSRRAKIGGCGSSYSTRSDQRTSSSKLTGRTVRSCLSSSISAALQTLIRQSTFVTWRAYTEV